MAKDGFFAGLTKRLARETNKEVRRAVTGSPRTVKTQIRRKVRKEITGSSNRISTQAAKGLGFGWLVRLLRGGK